MDTKEVVARFEAERQALALMEHTSIARVLDGGVADFGRPYFVMELVKGIRINDYCDTKRLGTKERLGLFIKVCLAVQHAHQKGVIHRDLKPSNILVVEQDGQPVPKVIDFGIAKAMGQRLTDNTFFTRLHQVIGTPAYMSPEQAGLGNLDIDTRSDVFSLGVLLYELLTGRTPFLQEEILNAGMNEVLRMIREVDPPKPSTRLSTLQPSELSSVAARRRVEPQRLGHLVRGELDWIVMRALEKERTRRYESAGALADDIQRHLQDEPVQAAPPGAVYRLRKTIRQHRQVFVAIAFALLVLTVGAAFSTLSFLRERAARLRADESELNANRNAYVVGMQAVSINRDVIGRKDLNASLELWANHPERGFEWYFWQRILHSELLAIEDYPGFIPPVTFYDNDRQIVGGVQFAKPGAMQWQAAIAWWDASSGAESRVFEVGDRSLGGVGPDHLFAVGMGGVELAVSDHSAGRVTRHETKTALELWQTGTKPRELAAFGYSGANLLLALEDQQSRTLVVRTAGVHTELPVFEDFFNFERVGFSPNGNLIVRWGNRPLEVGRLTPDYRQLFRAENQPVTVAAFSPQETVLVTGNRQGELLKWDLTTSNPTPVPLGKHASSINAIALALDGKVASGDENGNLKIWRFVPNVNPVSLKAHEGTIEHLAFADDGSRLVSIGRERYLHDALRVWDVAEYSGFQVIVTNRVQVTAICFSPDDQRLLLGHADGSVRIHDLARGQTVPITVLPRAITWVAFSPEGNQVSAGTTGSGGNAGFFARVGEVFESGLWDSDSGSEVMRFQTTDSSGDYPCFSPDGKWVARENRDSSVMFYDRTSGKVVNSSPLSMNSIQIMRFAPKSDRLLIVGPGQNFLELVPKKGAVPSSVEKQELVIPMHQGIWAINGEHPKHLVDSSTPEFTQLVGRSASIHLVAYDSGYGRALSGDASRLAMIENGSIRIRDTKTGNWLLDLSVPDAEMAKVAFSSDGLLIAGAENTGRVLLWRAAQPTQVAAWKDRADEAANKRQSRKP